MAGVRQEVAEAMTAPHAHASTSRQRPTAARVAAAPLEAPSRSPYRPTERHVRVSVDEEGVARAPPPLSPSGRSATFSVPKLELFIFVFSLKGPRAPCIGGAS